MTARILCLLSVALVAQVTPRFALAQAPVRDPARSALALSRQPGDPVAPSDSVRSQAPRGPWMPGPLGLTGRNRLPRVAPAAESLASGAATSLRASGRHEGTTLMIVGGAGMIGGLLVGGASGNAISVIGLCVGLYGLYLYVR